MKLLALETATSWQSVAILEGDVVLARADEEAQSAHGRRLIPTVDRLLSETGLSLRDLGGLAVSIGPGSFTGLRVGLATVLGFRLVTGLPIAAVPTLEALAWNVIGADKPICPVLRARTGEVYWALYRWENRQLITCIPPQVGPPQAIGKYLEEAVLPVGEGWLSCREEILVGCQARPLEPPNQDVMRASAVSVGLAGAARLRSGQAAGEELAPLYVQRAEAELVWEAKQRREPRKTVP